MEQIVGYPVLYTDEITVYEVRPLFKSNTYYWLANRVGSQAVGPFSSIVEATMHYESTKPKTSEEKSNVIFVDFKRKRRI